LHGELAKSVQMLQRIAVGEKFSPTAFSLSVDNAIAGLFSIAYHNPLPNTVIVLGKEAIVVDFIEHLAY